MYMADSTVFSVIGVKNQTSFSINNLYEYEITTCFL